MALATRGFAKFFFLVIVLLLIVIWFLPAPLIKWGIEKYGTQAVGAKVDVADVDFSWLSANLALHELAVTNPQKPMTNLVAFNRIATEVNISELIAGQVYLNELAVEGIALDSQRTSSGAVPGLQNDAVFAESESGFAIPGVDMPDTQALVEQEKAVYEKRIHEVEAQIAAKKQEWQKLKDSLPDKAQLEAYKARFNELKKKKDPLSRIAALKDLNELSKDIKKDVKSFEKAKDQVQAEYQALRNDLNALKQLPDQSFADIVKTLGLEDSRLAALGANLLEGPMRVWLEKGYNYYKVMSGGGSETALAEETPQAAKTKPALFVELTKISGPFTQGGKAGEINGVIKNFSDAPSLAGKPILIDLQAKGEQLGLISVDGQIDHTNPGKEQDKLVFKMAETALENFRISESESLNLLLEKALLNLDATASITSLSQLSVDFNSIFKSLTVAAGGEGELSSTQKAIISAVKQLSELVVDGSAQGSLKDPQLNLSTNLDDVLKSALGGVIKEKTQAFKTELTGKLNAQLNEKLGPLNEQLKNALGVTGEIDQQGAGFEQLLKGIK